jgi:hypothetical protein
VKIAAVVDSTCLIGLERIGRLDLISALLDPILAPPAVVSEFGSHPEWLTVLSPANSGTVAALKLVVDAGEAEAIALALERGCRPPSRIKVSRTGFDMQDHKSKTPLVPCTRPEPRSGSGFSLPVCLQLSTPQSSFS